MTTLLTSSRDFLLCEEIRTLVDLEFDEVVIDPTMSSSMIFLLRREKEDSLEGMEASVVGEIDEEFSTTSRRFGYVRRSKIQREAEKTL